MQLNKNRQGELFVLIEALLWGAFPVLALLTYRFVSPLATLAWSTLFAAGFFAVLLTVQKKWKEIGIREAWIPIVVATLISGILYYVFFFFGLRFTTAGNAALIAQMEIWFSLLFFGFILKKETYTPSAILGSGLMFAGVVIVLLPGELRLNIGDILILLAAAIAPISNNFQQKARKKVSAITLLFWRSLGAAVFLFLLLGSMGQSVGNDFYAALPILLLNGILLFGLSKIFWIEAIHRIPVAKAASLNTVVPVLTLVYAFFLLDELPTVWQLVGLPLIIAGTLCITRKSFLHEPAPID